MVRSATGMPDRDWGCSIRQKTLPQLFKELNYTVKQFQVGPPAPTRARVAPRSRHRARSFSCPLVPTGSSSPCPSRKPSEAMSGEITAKKIKEQNCTSSHGEPANPDVRLDPDRVRRNSAQLTRRRQHCVSCENCIRARHKAHCLLRLVQCLTSGGESDDGVRQYNSSSRNGAQKRVVGHRLQNNGEDASIPPSCSTPMSAVVIRTGLFSIGVPGIGTIVITRLLVPERKHWTGIHLAR